ncbi:MULTISPECIES: anti-sigma factor family protein [Pseudomonas]|jgi:anti-sigma factor RsiW|uniref:anti-sigma factor family protein n=1 Tax=Pseudomonas TaxID=286 RepID=UPI000DA8268D|nr:MULTISPECIES: zf-HC2 domain-containing protein [Pseudomonas]MDW3711814.1 zf-HC2 domain-containing protein [Pseudomonas sp. 2023EL-01195]PZE13976.1 anti-sigma factor [Pseudomonas sp. 57B-090624]
MLNCRELVARSSDYIDGQLGFVQRLGVRQHLLVCPHCRRFLAQLHLTRDVLRQLPEATPPGAEQLAERLARARNEAP